jgi:hypothetical protein
MSLEEIEKEISSSSGFCLRARRGDFAPEAGKVLLTLLNRIHTARDFDDKPKLQRRLFSTLWELPYFLEHQVRRIARNGHDAYRYIILVSQIRTSIARILGHEDSTIWADFASGLTENLQQGVTVGGVVAKAQDELTRALSQEADTVLSRHGFVRLPDAPTYSRSRSQSFQRLTVGAILSPPDRFGSSRCSLIGRVQVDLPVVGDAVLHLLGGEDWRLSSRPWSIVDQPLEFVAAEKDRRAWIAPDLVHIDDVVADVVSFAWRFALPFLDIVTDPESFIQVYESKDSRFFASGSDVYLKLAACYQLADRTDFARSLLESRLSELDNTREYALALLALRS